MNKAPCTRWRPEILAENSSRLARPSFYLSSEMVASLAATGKPCVHLRSPPAPQQTSVPLTLPMCQTNKYSYCSLCVFQLGSDPILSYFSHLPTSPSRSEKRSAPIRRSEWTNPDAPQKCHVDQHRLRWTMKLESNWLPLDLNRLTVSSSNRMIGVKKCLKTQKIWENTTYMQSLKKV